MLTEGACSLFVAGVFLGVHCAVILASFLLLNAILFVARRKRVKPLLVLPTGWLLVGALALPLLAAGLSSLNLAFRRLGATTPRD